MGSALFCPQVNREPAGGRSEGPAGDPGVGAAELGVLVIAFKV